MTFKIKGKANYQSIEGGFWSIISDTGRKIRPQNMPVQFMEEGAYIECRIQLLEEDFGFIMWGEYARIVSFKTVGT